MAMDDYFYKCNISTHALHAERDLSRIMRAPLPFHFNSRAPCGARRRRRFPLRATHKFQLTRSMRSATLRCYPQSVGVTISTHALHAERDLAKRLLNARLTISTHALHAERDYYYTIFATVTINFNSRAPCGARHE